jgi:hypothetical protein
LPWGIPKRFLTGWISFLGAGNLPGMVFVQQANGGGDFAAGSIALDAAGGEDDFQGRIAAFDDMKDILNGGTGGGGHQANTPGESGQWTLAFGCEQAFGIELLLKPFESSLQGTNAFQLQGDNAELILTARFVNSDFALKIDFATIL